MTVQALQAHPTKELRDFVASAPEQSALACSTVRKDFPCDDGILAVSSHAGGEIEYAVEPLPEPAE